MICFSTMGDLDEDFLRSSTNTVPFPNFPTACFPTSHQTLILVSPYGGGGTTSPNVLKSSASLCLPPLCLPEDPGRLRKCLAYLCSVGALFSQCCELYMV